MRCSRPRPGLVEKPNTLFNIIVKKYCKDVDITDINLIERATYKCLSGKIKRKDTLRLLSTFTSLSPSQIYCIIHRYGMTAASWIIDRLTSQIRKEILEWDIKFPPIWYRNKMDRSCKKMRRVGIQNIKHQIYDYIAIEGLMPLLRRIGEHQYASIEGRGPLKGARQIRRWLKNKAMRYAAKADIKKCYQNIKKDKLMVFLRKHVKNDLLLKLVQLLLDAFEEGLSIGSYLSQYLCNLYMSVIYHEVMENMHRIRKHKDGTCERINLVKHAIFFADDILILGTNKKDIRKAMKLIVKMAADMGLVIKPDYQVYRTDKICTDMMGYKNCNDRMIIRGRVFLRIRKAYRKAWKYYKTRKRIAPKLAKRCMSYSGYFKHTDSKKITRKLKVKMVKKICKGVIKRESKIFRGTGAGENSRSTGKNICIYLPASGSQAGAYG